MNVENRLKIHYIYTRFMWTNIQNLIILSKTLITLYQLFTDNAKIHKRKSVFLSNPLLSLLDTKLFKVYFLFLNSFSIRKWRKGFSRFIFVIYSFK